MTTQIQPRCVSDVKHSMSEAEDLYYRAMQFEHDLLVANFAARYDFQTSERVRFAQIKGVPQKALDRYTSFREAHKALKIAEYSQKLFKDSSDQAFRYSDNLRKCFQEEN